MWDLSCYIGNFKQWKIDQSKSNNADLDPQKSHIVSVSREYLVSDQRLIQLVWYSKKERTAGRTDGRLAHLAAQVAVTEDEVNQPSFHRVLEIRSLSESKRYK